jgi:hypothetical protein
MDSAYSHADDSFHARPYFLADRENFAIYHFSVRDKETLLKIDHAFQKTRGNTHGDAEADRLKPVAGGLNLGIEN